MMNEAMAEQVNVFADDALGRGDATAVAQRIRDGEVSAREVCEAAIARLEAANPALNALQSSDFARARARADQSLTKGFFAGVPTVLKDNVDYKGLPTQQGSRAFVAQPARRHDPFVQQLLAQGLVVLGKSRLPEFGFNGTTEYDDGSATHNPWDLRYSAGGSSGGSAALVACGALPIAHGNDGGGSIRIPASACGLVGLKVSRNRFVNSIPSRSLPVNMISDGVLTRSVRDTARFLAEAEGYFHNARYPRVGWVSGPGERRLRIGVLTESIGALHPDAPTLAAVEVTAQKLAALGHDLVPMPQPIPRAFVEAFLVYYGFMGFILSKVGRWVIARDFDASRLDGLSRGLRARYQREVLKTPQAIWQYRQAQELYRRAMQGFDAVLSPVTATPAPELGHLSPSVDFEALIERLINYASFTPVQNTLGTPAISLPMGQTPEGRPLGIQLSALAGQEQVLLELAYALEGEGFRPMPQKIT